MNFSDKEKNQLLGQYLKDQRTQKNISLEQIANQTGVPLQHLKNVEDGLFDRYDQFYLKMYIKKYSGVVNLNVDEIYQRFYSEEIKKTVETKVKKQKSKKVNLYVVRSLLTVGVVLVLGSGIVAMVNKISSTDKKPKEEVVIQNPNSQDLINTEHDTDNEKVKDEVTIEENKPKTLVSLVSQQNQEANFEVTTESDEFEISLIFTGDCWLDGKLDGNSIIPGTVFKNEETVVYKVTSDMLKNSNGMVSLNVGNVSVVQLQINKELIEVDQAIPHQYVSLNLKFE
ncbi:MAG: helix-turn-helix domain-containing protein [Turicibacter sp.]